VVTAEDPVCVAAAESKTNVQEGNTVCLFEKDLSEYDYISVGRDDLVPVRVKPTNMTRLDSMGVQC
jgi:hypothetical protein